MTRSSSCKSKIGSDVRILQLTYVKLKLIQRQAGFLIAKIIVLVIFQRKMTIIGFFNWNNQIAFHWKLCLWKKKKEMLSRISITQNNGLLKNNSKLENHYSKASKNTTPNYAILHWIYRLGNLYCSSNFSLQYLAASIFFYFEEVWKVMARLETLNFWHFLFTFKNWNFTKVPIL